MAHIWKKNVGDGGGFKIDGRGTVQESTGCPAKPSTPVRRPNFRGEQSFRLCQLRTVFGHGAVAVFEELGRSKPRLSFW